MGNVEGEHILVTTVREQFAAAESQCDAYVKDSMATPSVAPYASREEVKRLLQALLQAAANNLSCYKASGGKHGICRYFCYKGPRTIRGRRKHARPLRQTSDVNASLASFAPRPAQLELFIAMLPVKQ